MITINNLTMGFSQRTLFRDVSLSIFRQEKIGLTGPNGAGKTTLFSIILGGIEPIVGYVQLQKNLNIGFLPQEAHFTCNRTVLEEVTSGDSRIVALKAEQHQLEEEHKADSMRYGDVLHELEQLGIYDLEHKAEKNLFGLGFKQEDLRKPINQLSGGWQMRTLLAKLLTYQYDLLLLDEPTNYLDLGATLWLKDFLKNYQGTFVVIAHDKVFLNDVTNYTIILEDGRMTKVKGNYEEYERMKEERYKSLERTKKVVDKKRAQLERFAERFHAQPNKASAVRNKRKMLERLETIELPPEKVSIKNFEFPQTRQSGYTVITLNNVSKSYSDKKVYDNLDFEITKGQKVCLVGPNGAGKTTLLKMLAGVMEFDSGERKLGHQVDLGYFSQTRLDVLQPDRSAFDEVAIMSGGAIPAVQIRTLLGIFNFRGDDVFKQVKVLSGGEKSRLILAKLLINPPNFLCLDEPTTHLDIDGVEALTRAFKLYQGTLCFISHDLFFVKEIANHIVEVEDGHLKAYPSGFDYYLEKKSASDAAIKDKERQLREEGQRLKRESHKGKELENPVISELHERHKSALKRIEDIKKEIKRLAAEQKALETEACVKSRVLSESFRGRDKDMLRTYGQRLKEIQGRIREIGTTIDRLAEEKNRISK